MALGYHLIADIYGCDRNKISSLKEIEEIFISTAKEINATIVSSNFNMFYPYGISGVLIIAESHFTIHTWVEEEVCAIDLFVCSSSIDLKKGLELIVKKLGAKNVEFKFFERIPLNEKRR